MKELYGRDGNLMDTWTELLFGNMSGYDNIEDYLNALFGSIQEYRGKSEQELLELEADKQRISQSNELSLDTI
jgi:hypothetical protein